MNRLIFSMTAKIAMVLLVVVAVSIPVFSAETGMAMLTEYFDLLVTGNYESASYLWQEKCQERATRFGITYTDIPLKADCGSPIVRNIDLMKDYLQPPVKKVHHLSDKRFSKLEYSAVVAGNPVRYDYYAYSDGNYSWLLYPQDYHSRDWPVRETKYFRIHSHPDVTGQLNSLALAGADEFVEATGRSLGLTDEDIKLLETRKIEYFFCDSDDRVNNITGHLIKGTYDLASDDIISAFFPHFHEITHFLVNFRLRTLPLYTLPILREGIAVHFGGRWGKSPESLVALGAYLCREKIVGIDSILTMTGFEANAASGLGYPLAGVFTGYLIDKIGQPGFLELYLKLSGKFEILTGMSTRGIQRIIMEATGYSNWADLLNDYDSYLTRVTGEMADIRPGAPKGGKVIVESEQCRLLEKDDWLIVELSSADSTGPTGNILFGLDEPLKGVESSLFESQYGGKELFEGYRWGIRADQYEAGVYDYATNTLVAKYIRGITPSEDYYVQPERQVRFVVKKDLFGSDVPRSSTVKLLPK